MHILSTIEKRIESMTILLRDLEYLVKNFPNDLNKFQSEIYRLKDMGYKFSIKFSIHDDLKDYNLLSKNYLELLKRDIVIISEELKNEKDLYSELKFKSDNGTLHTFELRDIYSKLDDYKSKKDIPFNFEIYNRENQSNLNRHEFKKFQHIETKKKSKKKYIREYSTSSATPNSLNYPKSLNFLNSLNHSNSLNSLNSLNPSNSLNSLNSLNVYREPGINISINDNKYYNEVTLDSQSNNYKITRNILLSEGL